MPENNDFDDHSLPVAIPSSEVDPQEPTLIVIDCFILKTNEPVMVLQASNIDLTSIIEEAEFRDYEGSYPYTSCHNQACQKTDDRRINIMVANYPFYCAPLNNFFYGQLVHCPSCNCFSVVGKE